MPGFLDEVEKCFSSRNLYEALGVEKVAGEEELKKAYRRLSLKVHPDRVEQKDVAEATQKFQVLSKVYNILSDKDKRAVYDEQGAVDEDDTSLTEDKDWLQYWNTVFPPLTVEDIRNFEKTYKGSEKELDDLKSAYLKWEGDMDHIMDEVLCTTIDDEPRFIELLTTLTKEGTLPSYPAFVKENRQKRKRRRKWYEQEAKEAEEMGKREGLDGGENSLKAMIRARQQSRSKEMGNIIGALEEKYCKGKASGSQTSKKKAKKKSS